MPFSAETIKDVFNMFTGASPLFWFLPAAFLLALFGDRPEAQIQAGDPTLPAGTSASGRAALAAAFFALCLILFNPVTFRLYDRFVGRNTFYRFFWILPCFLAMAYVLMRIVSLLPKDGIKLAVVLLICLPILYFKAGPPTFFIPYSIWQIPVETSYFADRMDEIMDENGIPDSVLLCDEDIAFTIRTYEPRLLIPFEPRHFTSGAVVEAQDGSNMATLMTQLRYNDVVMDPAQAERLFAHYNVHFVIVFKDDASSTEFLKSRGFLSAGVCRDRELFYRV